MRMITIRTLGLLAPLAFATGPSAAWAHHGFGTFAMDQDVEITGVVTGLDFVNPHSWLYLQVTEAGGTVADYRCEMRSANTLRRSGWTPDLFPVGKTVTITGSPDRRDPYSCYVSTLIFDDGSRLDRYGQRTFPTDVAPAERPLRLANGEPNISGDWAQEQRVMTDPRGQRGTLVPLSRANDFGVGGVPEGQSAIPGARGTPQAAADFDGAQRGFVFPTPSGLTEAGIAAYEAFDFSDRYSRSCVNTSIIADWGGEPINRVTQNEDTILLQYGRLGLERTIHMNMDRHPAQISPSLAGHSIGHWDDDVLIVDTIGFEPGLFSQRLPHSDQLHVVEEFWYDPDAQQLNRRHTAEDPLYWNEPRTGAVALDIAELPYDPERCEDLTIDEDTELGPHE